MSAGEHSTASHEALPPPRCRANQACIRHSTPILSLTCRYKSSNRCESSPPCSEARVCLKVAQVYITRTDVFNPRPSVSTPRLRVFKTRPDVSYTWLLRSALHHFLFQTARMEKVGDDGIRCECRVQGLGVGGISAVHLAHKSGRGLAGHT